LLLFADASDLIQWKSRKFLREARSDVRWRLRSWQEFIQAPAD